MSGNNYETLQEEAMVFIAKGKDVSDEESYRMGLSPDDIDYFVRTMPNGSALREQRVILSAMGANQYQANTLVKLINGDLSPSRFNIALASGYREDLVSSTKKMWEGVLYRLLSSEIRKKRFRRYNDWRAAEFRQCLREMLDKWPSAAA